MARCPILMHAQATSKNYEFLTDIVNPETIPEINCLKENCQMWNTETNDCGLKQLFTVPQPQVSSDLPDINTLPRPGITIPEKDWPHQVNQTEAKPNFHVVDCPPPPSEPE